jgi:hypothetical protein
MKIISKLKFLFKSPSIIGVRFCSNRIYVHDKYYRPLKGLTRYDFEFNTNRMFHRAISCVEIQDGKYEFKTYRPIEKIKIIKKGYRTKFINVF